MFSSPLTKLISFTAKLLHLATCYGHCYHNYLLVGVFWTFGIPRFMLVMWGHIKTRKKQKRCKSRLLSSTRGE